MLPHLGSSLTDFLDDLEIIPDHRIPLPSTNVHFHKQPGRVLSETDDISIGKRVIPDVACRYGHDSSPVGVELRRNAVDQGSRTPGFDLFRSRQYG